MNLDNLWPLGCICGSIISTSSTNRSGVLSFIISSWLPLVAELRDALCALPFSLLNVCSIGEVLLSVENLPGVKIKFRRMSFQDIQNGAKPSSSAGRLSSQNPSQAVAAGIFQINTAVARFRRLVDAIGTAKDTPEHRQNLQNTRQSVMQLVKETSARLKSLSESSRGAFVDPSKRIEDAKLARDFQTTLQEFQKVQQLASERESTYSPFSMPSSLSTESSSGQHTAAVVDKENQPFLMEQKRQELLLLGNEIAFNEAIMEEREQGIRDIQDQIGQANEIFKDLAVLVDEQGVVIDDIHSNIEASSTATTQARGQLYKASKSAKSKCSWCWWVLTVLVVVLVIILLVLII